MTHQVGPAAVEEHFDPRLGQIRLRGRGSPGKTEGPGDYGLEHGHWPEYDSSDRTGGRTGSRMEVTLWPDTQRKPRAETNSHPVPGPEKKELFFLRPFGDRPGNPAPFLLPEAAFGFADHKCGDMHRSYHFQPLCVGHARPDSCLHLDMLRCLLSFPGDTSGTLLPMGLILSLVSFQSGGTARIGYGISFGPLPC